MAARGALVHPKSRDDYFTRVAKALTMDATLKSFKYHVSKLLKIKWGRGGASKITSRHLDIFGISGPQRLPSSACSPSLLRPKIAVLDSLRMQFLGDVGIFRDRFLRFLSNSEVRTVPSSTF